MAPYLYVSFGPHTIKVNRDHRHVSVWFALLFISSSPIYQSIWASSHHQYEEGLPYVLCTNLLKWNGGRYIMASLVNDDEEAREHFIIFCDVNFWAASTFKGLLRLLLGEICQLFFAAVALIWWQIRYQYGTRRFHFTSNNGTKWNLPLHMEHCST